MDAQAWADAAGPAEVMAMVRRVPVREPTPRSLQQALYRAQLTSNGELTRQVAQRCQDHAYANEFGNVMLRAD